MFKLISWAMTAGLALSATAQCARAEQPLPQRISLEGHAYSLELQLNNKLADKIRGVASMSSAQHFRGRLPELAGSWVRMSLVQGEWSGLASVGEQSYLIGSPSRRETSGLPKNSGQATTAVSLQASPVSELSHTQCATKVPHSSHSAFWSQSTAASPVSSHSTVPAVSTAGSSAKAHSVFEQPAIARADLSELCVSTVDGVCLLAEVEFVFDHHFQNEVDDPQALASSIINIVEGYYAESFNIEFDVISTEFLSSAVFTESTDPDVLLGGVDAMHPEEDPASVRAMSGNSQLAFESSLPALLHLVTGRNFDGGTAGIAFTDVLCNRRGFAVGASQLVARGSGNEAASTAIIVAHEMGHNFGASHDTTDNNCASGFLMEPSLRRTTAGFSSCSISEIDTAIDNLSSLQQCFNFPVDVSIRADAENPAEAATGVEFQSQFAISLQQASQPIAQLSVQGNVSEGDGSFTSVMLNGAACSLGSGNQSYTCLQNTPGASASLQVSAVGNSSSVAFQHSANVTGSTELVEINPGNNGLSVAVDFTGTAPPPNPGPDPDPDSGQSGGDADRSETVVEQSGGGGAAGLGSVLLLALAAGLLRTARRIDMAACLRSKARCALAVVGSGLLLSACGSVSPVGGAEKSVGDGAAVELKAAAVELKAAAQEQKNETGEGRYTVVQQKQCYCDSAFTRPIKIWVENGSVVQARYLDDSSPVSEGVKSQLRSLEHWQSAIQQWRLHKPNRLDVRFDETSKMLSYFDFDPSALKSDDEFSLTFSDYQPQQ